MKKYQMLILLVLSLTIICSVTFIGAYAKTDYELIDNEKRISNKDLIINGVACDVDNTKTFKTDPDLADLVKNKDSYAYKTYQASIIKDIEKVNYYQQEYNNYIAQKYGIGFSDNYGILAFNPGWAESKRITNIFQNPQIKGYYCGPAAAKSVLGALGVNKTQTFLAGSTYLKTEIYGNSPWYISNGNDFSQFPMPNTLRALAPATLAVPSPYGTAGANPNDVEMVKSIVCAGISGLNHGVLACGASIGSNAAYRLPGYPTNQNIGHWLAIDGYINYANTVWIVDSAKSSVISWSGSISAYYTVSGTLLRNFVQPRGLVY